MIDVGENAPLDLRNEDNVRRIIEALPDKQLGMALDIGAKYGLYTDLLASKFEHVVAFECDPDNFKVLEQNVKAPNVTLVKEAIGVEDGAMIKLYRSNDPGGSSTNEESPRFGGWGHTWSNYIWVPQMTLDTLWGNHQTFGLPPIRFIKCDIEGAEDYVFEHATNLLMYNKLTIVLECHQPVNFKRLYDLFFGLGYNVYTIDNKLTDHLRRDCHFIITNED